MLAPSNMKTSTGTVRLLGKGGCMTEDMIIKVFPSLLHTRRFWGTASVTAEEPNCSRCVTVPIAAGTGTGDVCRREEHKLPERRAETSRRQKGGSTRCCRATWPPTAEQISSLLISSTGSDGHQLKAPKRPVLPLPSLSLQLRSCASPRHPLVSETHSLRWSMWGQHSGTGTAAPRDSPAAPHCRV